MPIPWTTIVDLCLQRRGNPSSWWELSVMAGIPWDRLERLDLDCGEPSLDEALRIARALRCTVDDIWGSRAGAAPPPGCAFRHLYASPPTRKDCPCSNTSASPAASTAPASASPAST